MWSISVLTNVNLKSLIYIIAKILIIVILNQIFLFIKWIGKYVTLGILTLTLSVTYAAEK